RCQGLRNSADLDNVLRRQPLERPYRLPVIPELTVVVVFDDQAAGQSRPTQQFTASTGTQDTPGRELVSGRDQYRVCLEIRDDQSLVIHGLGVKCEAQAAYPFVL